MLSVPALHLLASLVLTAPAQLAGPSCLLPPVVAPIVDPFREPECTWCPGNRGLTYAAPSGGVVRAAAAGRVTFSGVVAGVRYVVVEHADGLRATYGGLQATEVEAGAVVVAGAVVGRSGEELHFGLRRGETYLDPAPLLGRLVERARLVPTDGTGRRSAPPPTLRCAARGPT
ncbi:MAG: peptidoglycan DD-metalloendopeptidase family protein [Ilumatobacteraceae bacterium]